MSDATRAAEILVGTSTWKTESYAALSYSLPLDRNPDMPAALKKLHIEHEIKDGRIVVSGLHNLATLYECNADLPGFGDYVSGKGV